MERMLMEYLVNSIWQAPVLAGGAWLVLRAGKPGPRVQHGVWVAALALMVAMPLLSLRGLRAESAPASVTIAEVKAAQPAAAQSVVDDSAALAASEDFAGAMDQRPSPGLESSSSLVQPPPLAKQPERWLRMREMRLGPLATRWLVGLYLAAIGLAMMRLLWSWMVAWRMVAEAMPAVLSEGESALLETCCERLQVRRPRVLVSEKTSTPLVVGVLRPALLLPEKFAERNRERAWNDTGREVEAVWLHELAHVRRRDYLANLMCRIWALPVAYHPVTHAVERRVRQTREMVCDRMAAEEMQSPVKYARCLVGLAQRMQDGHAMAEQMQGVGMFDGGVLEERVVELIGKKVVEGFLMRAVRATCGVAMLMVVMGAAATFHVTPTMAQGVVPKVADSVVVPQMMAAAVVDAPVASNSTQVVQEKKALYGGAAEAQIAAQSSEEGHVLLDRIGAHYKTWLDQDALWIITPEEREAFTRLSNDEERDQFIANFWLRRDAPGAPADSYKEEHYQRIAYANEHFAAGMPGWRTDRGRTYIVNGKPDSVDASPSGMEGGAPTEIWRYRSLLGSGREATMKFVDGCRCGEYRLQSSADLPVVTPFKKVVPGGVSLSNPVVLLSLPSKGSQPQIVYTVVDGRSSPVFKSKAMMQTSAQPPAETSADAQEAAPVAPAGATPAQPFPAPRHKTLVQPIEPQTPIAPKFSLQQGTPQILVAPKFSLQPGLTIGKAWRGSGDEFPELTKEQRLQLSDAMQELFKARMKMQQAQEAFQRLNTPEFSKQFDEIQKQAKYAMEKMNSAEFQQTLAEAQKDAAKLNSSEFRKQFEEMQRQVKEASEKLNTPEFKQKLADAQKDATNWNAPEMQKQMAEMRVARLKQQLDQAQKDLDRLNSGEGKKKVDTGAKQPSESH